MRTEAGDSVRRGLSDAQVAIAVAGFSRYRLESRSPSRKRSRCGVIHVTGSLFWRRRNSVDGPVAILVD